jgi:putative copper export protein/methionine-rich copper-binding protein CopC
MIRTAIVVILVAVLAVPVYAHVTLVASAPAAGEVVESPPTHIVVSFSGRVEPRYSTLMVMAPDGSQVPLGSVAFTAGSDREFMAALPPVNVPGRYTVRWRTAGADGHVLEGSFFFTLAGDTAAADPADTTSLPLPAPSVTDHGHVHDEAHHDHGGGGVVLPVVGRWLHFLALTLLIGAVTFRLLLLPRIAGAGPGAHDMQRRGWRIMSVAALLLALSAVLRLWTQSAALHGTEAAWSSALLSIMLTDTLWGRAWLVQAFFFAVLGAGIMLARPGRDRAGIAVVAIAAAGLAAVPALSGHAAGAGLAELAVVVDTIHVLGVGAWIGTLAIVLFAAIPSLLRHDAEPALALARVVDRFSPLALSAAVVVALSGVVNSLMHIGALSHLVDTGYGRILLAKLAAVLLVVGMGFYHWRVVRPRLGDVGHARRLRASIAAELLLATVVLLITAVLTGQPRP